MIEVYKIIHNHYDANVTVNVSLNKTPLLEVINIKLTDYSFHYSIRKYSCPRVGLVNIWILE